MNSKARSCLLRLLDQFLLPFVKVSSHLAVSEEKFALCSITPNQVEVLVLPYFFVSQITVASFVCEHRS